MWGLPFVRGKTHQFKRRISMGGSRRFPGTCLRAGLLACTLSGGPLVKGAVGAGRRCARSWRARHSERSILGLRDTIDDVDVLRYGPMPFENSVFTNSMGLQVSARNLSSFGPALAQDPVSMGWDSLHGDSPETQPLGHLEDLISSSSKAPRTWSPRFVHEGSKRSRTLLRPCQIPSPQTPGGGRADLLRSPSSHRGRPCRARRRSLPRRFRVSPCIPLSTPPLSLSLSLSLCSNHV